MPKIRCFMMVESDQCELYLRRYSSASGSSPICPAGPYKAFHNANVTFQRYGGFPPRQCIAAPESLKPPTHDPRWPLKCQYCDYQFTPQDPFQLFIDRLYFDTRNGNLVPHREFEPGAMWDSWWSHFESGDDGMRLSVMTPGGEWCIDAPSVKEDGTPGNPWQRHGVAPDVTARPSIRVLGPKLGEGQSRGPDKYHGWLTDGYLVDA